MCFSIIIVNNKYIFGSFNGFIAQLDYSNAALPVGDIYNIYRRGPKLEKSVFESVKDFGTGVSNVLTE